MSRFVRVSLCGFLMSVLFVAGCSGQPDSAAAKTPAAPTMPTGWNVSSDESFAPADFKPVAEALGGEVLALRNTVFDVQGKSVKLNTMVAASPEDADKIMSRLQTMKSDEFLLRQGLTIYEFVGTDDVIPEMHAGKAYIQANFGS